MAPFTCPFAKVGPTRRQMKSGWVLWDSVHVPAIGLESEHVLEMAQCYVGRRGRRSVTSVVMVSILSDA
jgi:hypothetical protein